MSPPAKISFNLVLEISVSKTSDLFEQFLSVRVEDIEFTLDGIEEIPWSPFWLNPRRLRGSDFLMRWSQGLWSEERFTYAVNQTSKYFCIAYGPSGTAPSDDVRAFELYFERLEAAGLSDMKRPDLLIFSLKNKYTVDKILSEIGGEEELPFTSEDDPKMQQLLHLAILAVECENSLWIPKKMPNYGEKLRPMGRLGGKLGLPKTAKLPTVIIKEEDRGRLIDWQTQRKVPIHVWHGFYDLAFGLALDRANELIEKGSIEPRLYKYQSANGSVNEKMIYNFYYHYAYPLAEALEDPMLVADYIVDKNGHILPYVRFEGGKMNITKQALEVVRKIARDRNIE